MSLCPGLVSIWLTLLAPAWSPVFTVATAQTLSGPALVEALGEGGLVIVMRHASSPRGEPDAASANPDNVNRERQLDAEGRETAEAMGRALRRLEIPVAEVLSSPTYRALETARLAGFQEPETYAELGDRGRGMQGVTDADAAWLREQAAQAPPSGANTLVVTHNPNIRGAFPDVMPAAADGESLVFRPDGDGVAALIGRIRIEEWPDLE